MTAVLFGQSFSNYRDLKRNALHNVFSVAYFSLLKSYLKELCFFCFLISYTGEMNDAFEPIQYETGHNIMVCRETNISHSDEGLKLETSVFESFAVANLPY